MTLPIALVLSYLIGALPTGVVICRVIKGVDPRATGSGSTGATNVSRVLGNKWGTFVLVIDALKGYLPVAFLAPALIAPEILNLGKVLVGAAAVIGHVWTVFARFRGGKGVGTATGVMLALDATSIAFALGVWLIIFIGFRIVSFASLGAAIALPDFVWLLGGRSLELRVDSILFLQLVEDC